jgi:AraC-like DNA-binding protein
LLVKIAGRIKNMKYLFFIAAFNALFFALMIFQKKAKALHDRILFIWLLYLGFFIAAYALSNYEVFHRINYFSNFIISMFLMHGPFLYLYVDSLSTAKNKIEKKGLLHFVPFLLFVIYLIISLYFPAYAERIRIDHVEVPLKPPVLFIFFLLVAAISGPVYFILSVKKIKTLKINIFNNFSTTDELNPDWLRALVTIFGVIWSVLILIAIIHHVFHFFTISFCINGLFLSLSAFVILIGYYGLRQKEIFTHFPEELTKHEKIRKTQQQTDSLKDPETAAIVSKIKLFMQLEKPHLNPDLTLPDLASSIGIPSYQLSRIINEQFRCNFFEFINEYRVNEVKSKINSLEWNHFSLLGIAFESGFNSKSAFNRVFKKVTGHTPSEYKSMASS